MSLLDLVDQVTSPHPYLRDRILDEAVPLDADNFRELAVIESQRPHMPLDRDSTYLRFMLDYCNDAIEMAAETNREAFLAERLTQRAPVMTVILVGENGATVSQDFRQLHPEIPWSEIVGFRNTGIDDYPALEFADVWDDTIQVSIPALKTQLEKLL